MNWIQAIPTTIPGRYALVDPEGHVYAIGGDPRVLRGIRHAISRALALHLDTGHTAPALVACGLTNNHGELTHRGYSWACHEPMPPDTRPN